MKCIYCLREKGECTFENTEHVIPQSFGKFNNNFTLNEIVCDDCNKYFGDNLEIFLARDSLEGFLRAIYQVKISANLEFPKERTILRLKEKGEWKSALVQLKYSESEGKIFSELMTQVGFLRKDIREFEFLSLGKIPLKKELDDMGYYSKGKKILKIFYRNDEENKLLNNELKEKGFNLEKEEAEILPFEHSNQSVLHEIDITVDHINCRAMGKITFNYLTHFMGQEFALNENFNDIRRYIRYGEQSENAFVKIKNTPIIKDEEIIGCQVTKNHLITLGWSVNSFAVISQVALFNSIKYDVVHCKNFRGIHRPMEFGHHFDIDSKEIKNLLSFPKRFWLPLLRFKL